MARLLSVAVVFAVVCAEIAASRADMNEDQVGQPKQPKEGETLDEARRQWIRSKGRTLFGHYRQKSGTLAQITMADWKSQDLPYAEMERRNKIHDNYRYVIKEGEYEIKQRIVDAIAGDKTNLDETIPAQSNEIASLFMEALFADTYEEQTANEDKIMEIAKSLLEP